MDLDILRLQKKLPEEGWEDNLIEMVLNRLSLMDSNNFHGNCSLGEREARFASALVAKRHYNFGHGVGRSGDLTEPQPKAAGSSLIYNLTNCLLQDIFKIMGMEVPIRCFLVPVATGMSLVLSMLSLRTIRPNAKYVIWSRIDQKSCFKSILTAGFIPVIIDMVVNGDQLETNIVEIEKKVKELKKDDILCVMTTTSCFAPRACDNIEQVAKICRTHEIPHLINNAYGLQSRYIMQRIQKAQSVGRVDIFVQSTDKNFMVPVGGAVVATFDSFIMENVAKLYPGRASSSPILDVFITLLSLGKEGYLKLVEQREESHAMLVEELKTFADQHEERVLINEDNPISIALSLTKIPKEHLTRLGSMLFIRNISGTRVVSLDGFKTIAQYHFKNWGSHTSNFETPYLTVAASIGIEDGDIEVFIKKLEKAMNKNAKLCDTITEELSGDKSSLEKGLSPSMQTLSNTSIIDSCDL
ncbi:O-phosphoseryl-tRNA(Sec) selenium transferase isoform X2 [Atheta coriaria]|uniref:O-phosphoseryl-tRNA(Sec) selenium transferase isoform X2 n=1 Tax=Dalotia coriaria TaxID=877792 RepID=UPI0031F3627C